jgi:hypothetical protein
MKITKSKTVTLALEGDSIPLEKFKQAVTSFLDLVESVSQEATGRGQKIKWDVSVKSGSALVSVTPQDSIETRAAVKEVLNAIPDGISALCRGITQPPRLFNASAIRAMKRLASVHELSENGLTEIRVLVKRKTKRITNKVAATVEAIIGTSYEAYGSVEGKLQALWDHGGFRFSVFDALFDRKIDCFVGDEMVEPAIKGFRHRVRVSGTVQYNKEGLPISINVTDIQTFRPNNELPSAADVRGIFKN